MASISIACWNFVVGGVGVQRIDADALGRDLFGRGADRPTTPCLEVA